MGNLQYPIVLSKTRHGSRDSVYFLIGSFEIFKRFMDEFFNEVHGQKSYPCDQDDDVCDDVCQCDQDDLEAQIFEWLNRDVYSWQVIAENVNCKWL